MASRVATIYEDEMVPVTVKFIDNFIHILPTFFNYTEEEKSIKPKIIFTRNIDKILKPIPSFKKVKLMSGSTEGNDLKRNLKSIMPFCNMSWIIYIDFKDSEVEYGILRAFSGIDGFTLQQQIFLDTEHLDSVALIYVEVLNTFELVFKGLHGSNITIDPRFHLEKQIDRQNTLTKLTNKLLLCRSVEEQKKCFNSLKRTLENMVGKSHGSIILIVDEEVNSLPTEIFSDGVWLEEPIDLVGEIFEIEKTENKLEAVILAEKYYAVCGLLFEMVNIDGATVMNSNGNILGFNCFANSNPSLDIDGEISGGARKRAFYSMLSWGSKNVIGAFFQSQDGEIIFTESRDSAYEK